MPAVFEKEYFLRTSDFDCRAMLKPSSVLELFQNAAGEHAAVLGCGFDDLAPKNLMWVILRTKYRLVGSCSMHETVRIRTWPCPPSRVGFRREYLVTGSDGREIARGSSEWALVDALSRRLVSGSAYPDDTEFCTEQCFAGRLERLRPFEGQALMTVKPGYSRIDVNGHVNNTAYADFALDLAATMLEEPVDEFQIDYRHELRPGCSVNLSCREDEGSLLICGRDDRGEPSFLCRMGQRK